MIRGTILALLLLLGGQYNPAGPVFPRNTGNPCLVSAWPMNEGSGTTLHDTAPGGSNTATIDSGAVTWQSNTGLPGTTPMWNGITTGQAAATSTTINSFDGTTPFSVSVWESTTVSGNQAFLSTLVPPGVFNGWELSTDNTTSKFRFYLINHADSNWISVHGGTNINTGDLFYLVATYDGSRTAAGVKLYVNGVAETVTVDANSLTATSASPTPVQIASRQVGSLAFHGAMAFGEVYNCVLTPTQITTYNAAGPGIY